MPPRSHCCPTLAAWLYSAFSPAASLPRAMPGYGDMPLLPDDSETYVSELGKAMPVKKVELPRPNSIRDLAFCYCGIRLHPFTCPAAGDSKALRSLELHCKFDNNGTGCSKCFRALYQLKGRYPADRTGDCELMGLTWLLAKDRAATWPPPASRGGASCGRRRRYRWRWTRRSGGRRIPAPLPPLPPPPPW